jgi:hypothetical protein
LKNDLEVVVSGSTIFLEQAARQAAMDNDVLMPLLLDAYRLHHAHALSSAISGIDVDVFAPETSWTMIRVAGSANVNATVLAGKILFCAGELFHAARIR